jgi:hypothetical protein
MFGNVITATPLTSAREDEFMFNYFFLASIKLVPSTIEKVLNPEKPVVFNNALHSSKVYDLPVSVNRSMVREKQAASRGVVLFLFKNKSMITKLPLFASTR